MKRGANPNLGSRQSSGQRYGATLTFLTTNCFVIVVYVAVLDTFFGKADLCHFS